MLLTTAFLFAVVPPASTQPVKIDWRSTLIFRFEPAVHAPAADDGANYLASIADWLESGWIAESGAGAVAIGPLFAPDPQSETKYAAIDPSLGTAADWMRLISEARRTNVVVAVHVNLPGSLNAYARLAEWAAESGVRHFIVESVGKNDVSALRAALDATLSGTSWIAGTSTAHGDPSDTGGSALDAVPADTKPGALDAVPADAGVASPDAARFDALIESVSIDDLGDDASLGALYKRFARRSAAAQQPLVGSVSFLPGSGHLIARVLMLPGALLVTTTAVPPDSSEFLRRICAFRARHPAISRGDHVDLVNNTLAFARTAADSGMNDRVVVVLGALGKTTLNVSRIFPDNAMLQDALTGNTAFVSFGLATFEAGPSGVILVEEAY